MEIYYLVVFFIIGICFGSFYNVVAYRLPNNMSLISPPSHCPNCNHKITPLELIPIFSFLFLKGKCKGCKNKISIIYPIIELITGILFALCYLAFGLNYQLIIALVLVSLTVIIFITDIKYLIIPDEILIVSLIIIIITLFINTGVINTLIALANGLIAFIITYLIMKIGNFIFKQESMGGGDIKLMFIVGLSITFIGSMLTFFIASLIAFPIALTVVIKKKNNVIPYGPFLIGSTVLIYFFQNLVMDIPSLFNLYLQLF